MSTKRYLSCAETAKLICKALARDFPGQKFGVRSHVYAGGASININWQDGPTEREVEKVAGMFAGADFDGMIDLKTYTSHWLTPDGQVRIAHAQGTENSRGTLPEIVDEPFYGPCEEVHFGADYVFCRREVSDWIKARVRQHIEEAYAPSCFQADWEKDQEVYRKIQELSFAPTGGR